MVASTFQQSSIKDSSPYWLEQIPYSLLVDSLAANANTPIFGSIQGWQPAQDPETLVSFDTLGMSQIGGVQVQITNDRAQGLYDAGAFAPDLALQRVGRVAVKNIAANIINTNSAAVTNLQAVYSMTVWNEPVAVKVLRGLELTADEKAWARTVGLDTRPNNQRGTLPIDLDAVIRGTYQNRQVDAALSFARRVSATTTGTPFHHARAGANQLLVLRSIALAGTLEDGVQLHVDRDGITDHVILDAAACSLGTPIPCFIPAFQTLTFRLTATTAPVAATPVRLEVWTVSLSNILRVRLGMVSESALAQLVGTSAQAQKLYAAVKAGMN